VVVDPRAEKRDLARRVDVAGGKSLELARQLLLGELRLEREVAVEADAGRDIAEELRDRIDADRAEHRVFVGVCES
jgi:hypothetical protein